MCALSPSTHSWTQISNWDMKAQKSRYTIAPGDDWGESKHKEAKQLNMNWHIVRYIPFWVPTPPPDPGEADGGGSLLTCQMQLHTATCGSGKKPPLWTLTRGFGGHPTGQWHSGQDVHAHQDQADWANRTPPPISAHMVLAAHAAGLCWGILAESPIVSQAPPAPALCRCDWALSQLGRSARESRKHLARG